jgi:hypothetical protein
MIVKCKYCKKEFLQKCSHHKYCCKNCKWNEKYYLNRSSKIKRNLNYYYKNKDKVLKRQKLRLKRLSKDKNSKYYIRHNLTPKIKKRYCEICGSTERLQRHHWNYNKPKLISILCKSCHHIQHNPTNPKHGKFFTNEFNSSRISPLLTFPYGATDKGKTSQEVK